MPFVVHNQYYIHTQGGSWNMDRRDILVNIYIDYQHILHSDHSEYSYSHRQHLLPLKIWIKLNKIILRLKQIKTVFFLLKTYLTFQWLWPAAGKWISYITFYTCANWYVIENVACRRNTTRSWARVQALGINTSTVTGTVRVYSAFWSAVWRASNKCRQTRAWWRAADFTTLRVRTTWRWDTGISYIRCKII